MNVQAWKHHQLVNLIKFGFPLDFDRTCALSRTEKNHISALKFSQHEDKYTEEELSFHALAGPFDDQSLALHIYPLMSKDKVGSNSKHTIIDLSWPKGLSINDGVSKDTT